jgi:hypothetical protein
MDSIYAGTDTQVEVSLPELLPAGDYTVTLWLEDSEHGVRAESGPLLISIPVLEAPRQIPAPETATDPAAASVVEIQTTGIPTWALLVAVPVAIVLGVLIALVVVLGMRRRSKPAAEMLQPVLVVAAPPVARSRPAIVRQMTPPSREV